MVEILRDSQVVCMYSGFDRKHVLSLVGFQLVGWGVYVGSVGITEVLNLGEIPQYPCPSSDRNHVVCE